MLGARSEDRLAELVEELRDGGADATHHRCDIGSAADTSALVADTVARYGRLDGASNNAGITGGGHGRLADLPEDHFDELSRVNFKGIWLAMRAEIPVLLSNPHAGVIVNTSAQPEEAEKSRKFQLSHKFGLVGSWSCPYGFLRTVASRRGPRPSAPWASECAPRGSALVVLVTSNAMTSTSSALLADCIGFCELARHVA
jgi:NAD(P)-dependent dehydrogenase (short-subunit alcohol dehydrogenase family)